MKKWCDNCQDWKVTGNGVASSPYGEIIWVYCETCCNRLGMKKVRVKLNPDNFIRRKR